jgi:hypothetical protein
MPSSLRRAMIGVALMGAAAGCSLLQGTTRHGEVRFRVDVMIKDDQVRRKGSGVWSFSLSKPRLALVSAYSSKFEAEAIPIELGGGAWAFVLPRYAEVSASASKWPELAFDASDDVRNGNGPSEIAKLGRMHGRVATIRCVYASEEARAADILCPSILLSSDISNPHSFKIAGKPTPDHSKEQLSIEALVITITNGHEAHKRATALG